MKSKYLWVFLALTLFPAVAASSAAERQLAFPGAEGYGRYATGGRGGKVYVVTSLADCQDNNLVEGTFRWAVKQPGRKIVVFRVSGTIYLTSGLALDAGDLTILGQTAPGDGICLADYNVNVCASNIIIRFLRFRMGDRPKLETDAVTCSDCENVIFDHCSVSWSTDECFSVGATNSTVQWCMIEQPLTVSVHTKGSHGYGGNWGGYNMSFHHNLMVNCASRMPRTGGDADPETNDFQDYRNNVYYNWAGEGCYGFEASDANVVNCYYKPGPGTDQRSLDRRRRIAAVGIRNTEYCEWQTACWAVHDQWGHFYIDGNVNPDYPEVNDDNWEYGVYRQLGSNGAGFDWTWTDVTRDTIRLRAPREFCHVTTHSAEEAYERVLKYAGCFGCSYKANNLTRDCVDSMLVADVRNRTGVSKGTYSSYGYIDTQTDNGFDETQVENGAWPILKQISYEFADYDGDYVNDTYEENWGMDSSDAADGGMVITSTPSRGIGYSYTEYAANYLNKSVRALMDSCTAGGEVMGVDEPTIVCGGHPDWRHEVSGYTFKGYDSSSHQWTFDEDIRVGGVSAAPAQSTNHTLKWAANAQWSISIPASIHVTSLRIEGFAMYNGDSLYVSEVGGKTLPVNAYGWLAQDRLYQTVVLPLDRTYSGEVLTLTFSGNTPTVKFYLIEDHDEEAAISKVETVCNSFCNFDLLGRPYRQNRAHGLSIRNGKVIFQQ